MDRPSVAARAPADRVDALAGDERRHGERRDRIGPPPAEGRVQPETHDENRREEAHTRVRRASASSVPAARARRGCSSLRWRSRSRSRSSSSPILSRMPRKALDLPVTGRSIVSAPDGTGRQAMAHALTIGRLARSAGMPAKTIRYYEEVGVLPPPRRSAAGYRQYTQAGVQRVLLIRRARALGVSLQQLKGLIVALDGGSGGALLPRLRELIRTHLGDVQRRIGGLGMRRQQLGQVLQGLETRRRGRAGGRCPCVETVCPA